jgi:Fe-Mn family superoxide dismutase
MLTASSIFDLFNHSHWDMVVYCHLGTNQGLFNNAAQTWNHNFYWNSLKAGGGGKPTGKVGEAIEKAFGGYDNFRKEFTTAANTQFGSGWAWLVQDKAGALKIVKTGNADVPVTEGMVSRRPTAEEDHWSHVYLACDL